MTAFSSEDVARVKAAIDCRELFERFWPERIKRRSGVAWSALCPFHEDRDPSLSIQRGYAKCFAGCTPASGNSVFDCFDLVGAATGGSFHESVRFLADMASIDFERPTQKPAKTTPRKGCGHRSPSSVSAGEMVAQYDYVDESGNLLFQVVRMEPKAFRQRRRGAVDEWIWNLDGVRRALYRLPEVIAAQSVVICEGEKDVDNLRPYLPSDWAATTAPGGAGKWNPDYSRVLVGKDVVVIPDNDNPGLLHLKLVATALKGCVRSLRVVFLDNVESLSMPVKDISDYLGALPTDGERGRVVRSLLGSASSVILEEADIEDESNDPLDRIPISPFPWGILPDSWLEHFQDLSESLAVAPEGVVSCALAILSGAIGNQIKVSPKPGWKTSVPLWLALVGDSGQGKTPIIQSLMQGLYDIQQKAFVAYQKEMEVWEANAQKKGDCPFTPPKLIRYFTTDPTIEALLALLSENPRGLILIKDELASLVCGFNQYKPGGRGNERQLYLSIFSGSPIIPDRKSCEKIYVRHPFLSLLGGVQRRLIPEVLGPDAFSDGLIFRFLFLVLDSKWYPLTRKSWREEGRDAWRSLITMAIGLNDERVLHLDNEAWDSFCCLRDRLYGLVGYLPPSMAGFMPKMADYALRLADVLHVWYAFPNFPPAVMLSGFVMDKAVRLTEFYLGQIRLLLQLYQQRRELRLDQRVLLSVLQDSGSKVDGGALPTSCLFEAFNSRVPTHIQFPNTRKLTALLKELASLAEVTLTFRPMRWHKKYCRCLVWEADKIAKLLRLLPAM
ncbi:MAG: DUF3987 domain-containing protein [Syntrophobacteraceae bacterium]